MQTLVWLEMHSNNELKRKVRVVKPSLGVCGCPMPTKQGVPCPNTSKSTRGVCGYHESQPYKAMLKAYIQAEKAKSSIEEIARKAGDQLPNHVFW